MAEILFPTYKLVTNEGNEWQEKLQERENIYMYY